MWAIPLLSFPPLRESPGRRTPRRPGPVPTTEVVPLPTRMKRRPRSALYCLERGCAYAPRTRRPTFAEPRHVVAFLSDFYPYPCSREVFVVLLLDVRNRLIRAEVISVGTLTASLVHPREVFASAITRRAASIVVAHNHPSGDPSPSEEDIALTNRLTEVGRILGIEVLDHVILGGPARYHSMKATGKGFSGGGS